MSDRQEPPGLWRMLLLRLLELAVLGVLTAGAISAALEPALIWIAGAGGGLYASRLYSWVRTNERLRAWVDAHYFGVFSLKPQTLIAGTLAWLFYSKATAAAVVAAISAIFSGVAIGLIAFFENDSLDRAWASFIAFLFSQLVYFLSHPRPEPQTTPADAAADAEPEPAGVAPGA